jgi:hypothetical protein
MISKDFSEFDRSLWITLGATRHKSRQVLAACALQALCADLLRDRRINKINYLARFHEMRMVRRSRSTRPIRQNEKWG